MKRISSKEETKCIEFIQAEDIEGTSYGQLIHYLLKTIDKDFPVEFMHVLKETTFRGKIDHFTVYDAGETLGESATLTIYYKTDDNEELQSICFENTGIDHIEKDRKSSSKSFFRFFVNSSNKTPQRLTFNRRLSK